jgi:hypothetical protein
LRGLIACAGSESGSALLISLVLILVMTLLGLALFDLAMIEGQLVLSSETDARSFEIAQAGLERALERLQRTMLDEQRAFEQGLLPAAAAPGWADGSTPAGGGAAIPLCTGGCETRFKVVDAGYIAADSKGFNGGSYEIAFKLLTLAEATGSPYGQACRPDAATPTQCADLIFVRSTGTLAGAPVGYSSSRTIQVLVRATLGSPFAAGLTVGTGSAQAITGNARVAGSIHVLDSVPGAPAVSFGLGAGQRNNWAGLEVTTLGRLQALPLVCPPGRSCSSDADKVESLGATLKVARPVGLPALTLTGGAAALGQPGDSAPYGGGTADNPTREGKGPLDGFFVADGCTLPCTDNFTGVSVGGNTHVDGANITRPYPEAPVAPFPLLTDPATIGGIPYAHYACPAGSLCFGQADFLVSHAANLTTQFDMNLGSPNGLRDDTGPFTIPSQPSPSQPSPPPLTYTNRFGASTTGEICWRRSTGPNLPPPLTLEFGSPSCDTPTSPQNPLLVYTTGSFFWNRFGGTTPMNYRGAALVLTTGPVQVEEVLQTAGKFGSDDLLAILTTNTIDVGVANSGVLPVMAFFYTQNRFRASPSTAHAAPAQVVGAIAAARACFATDAGCAPGGPNVPALYQVPLRDPNGVPPELLFGTNRPWRVAAVPGFWIECRRDSPPVSATSPAIPTGACGYE